MIDINCPCAIIELFYLIYLINCMKWCIFYFVSMNIVIPHIWCTPDGFSDSAQPNELRPFV